MKNSKNTKMGSGIEKHEVSHFDYEGPITDKMWREGSRNGKVAKEILINMSIGGKGKVKFVDLENGNRIAVQEVTEKQAQDFIAMLAPERVWKGYRQ